MRTFIFEVLTVKGYRIARVDAMHRDKALAVVRAWHPISIIIHVNGGL